MLLSDLLEVLLPVFLETHLFFTLGVELIHDVVETRLESLLEDSVVFVPSLDDGLVVEGVLDLDFARELVVTNTFLRLVGGVRAQRGLACVAFQGGVHIPIGLKLLLKVDLEDGWSKSWELPRGSLGQVGVVIHRHQVFDVLVLLLHDLISWQHDEVLLVNDGVEEFDERARVVQE